MQYRGGPGGTQGERGTVLLNQHPIRAERVYRVDHSSRRKAITVQSSVRGALERKPSQLAMSAATRLSGASVPCFRSAWDRRSTPYCSLVAFDASDRPSL